MISPAFEYCLREHAAVRYDSLILERVNKRVRYSSSMARKRGVKWQVNHRSCVISNKKDEITWKFDFKLDV